MIRYDDHHRILRLSVRDLVEGSVPRGHLNLQVVQRQRARMAAGQRVHQEYQSLREVEDQRFSREVTLKLSRVVGDWTVTLQGRVDGLVEGSGRWLIEEVKSTALDASRLYPTTLWDWQGHVAQLEVYLWMLQLEHPGHEVVGKLVLVSLADGARHTLPVPLAQRRVETWVAERLEEVVERREQRIEWMASRRQLAPQTPFPRWRDGQETIVDRVRESVAVGSVTLVQAPTGLGKTAAVLTAAIEVALATDRQVFWATTRTTQQPVVEDTLKRLEEAGMSLRAVTLNARQKVCLNVVNGETQVDCRPESCRFACDYFEKAREHRLIQRYRQQRMSRTDLREVGQTYEVCPYQLARDLSSGVDVVIGDTNYVFDPSSRLREFFDGDPAGWIVICDEVHQLVDRARGYRSPTVTASMAQTAGLFLSELGSAYDAFAFLARQVEDAVLETQSQVVGPTRGSRGVADLSVRLWSDLADRVEEVALDYALLKAGRAVEDPVDPYLDLARAVLRFQTTLQDVGNETVVIVEAERGCESVGLFCLDPSDWLGPQLKKFGGFVGVSATISPVQFYVDLLGLGNERCFVDVPPVFPPENQLVVLAPRISTAFRDRVQHAPATAELICSVIAEVPGNVAVYFPSFSMLQSVMNDVDCHGKEVLLQPRSLSEEDRAKWIGMLAAPERRIVLGAVLGGIFAEGVDLPEGSLRAVIVCGPAYPPVGLERLLLHDHFDEHYGAGFLYASLVPGMTKVVQAAGRLIRRPEDRGVVVLIGRRFRWRDVAAQLPERWEVEVPGDPAQAVRVFFQEEQ